MLKYKSLPHSFYILKVKCIFILIFTYIFMLQFCWNNILYRSMYTCYKIYSYFKFQPFTYQFSSVAHNATLMGSAYAKNISKSLKLFYRKTLNVYFDSLQGSFVFVVNCQMHSYGIHLYFLQDSAMKIWIYISLLFD